MEFTATTLEGAFLVHLRKIEDHRGFFARGWCRDEFTQHGLNAGMLQLNVGFSHKKGTLRGLHVQEKPYEEAKLIRCTRGAMYDVIVDLRLDSPTLGQWIATELTADSGVMVYAPEGFAHGYQTLTDGTEMNYMTTEVYVPSAAKGVLYSDPMLAIEWPLPVSVISDQDQNWPNYRVYCTSGLAK